MGWLEARYIADDESVGPFKLILNLGGPSDADTARVVLEEVIVLTITNRQEVEQVADVDVVCDGAEVADELGVEVQHVLQVAALAADPGPADAADLHVELLHLPREVRNLRLGSDHQTVLPDPLFLQNVNETF